MFYHSLRVAAYVCVSLLFLSSCSSYHKVAVWYKYRNDFHLPKPVEPGTPAIARRPTVSLTAETAARPEAAPVVASASSTVKPSRKHAPASRPEAEGRRTRQKPRRIAGVKQWTNLIELSLHPDQYVDSPVVVKKQAPFAVAGFVCGLVGIFLFGIILGLLGLIFSIIALNKIASNPGKYRKGLATAGVVLSIIALVGALIILAAASS